MAKSTSGSKPPVAKDAGALTERLRTIRDALMTGLVERDDAVRLSLLAAVAGEHLLLVGPPGTAKSLVASRLRYAFADQRYFERLLTRFSVPEELFGPLSIRGIEEDRYERKTEGYMPTSAVVFLDEIFKANSAILNSLLTLLNERKFDNGTERVDAPLIAAIGASNELPSGDDAEPLAALFDRFLLRLHVPPVSEDGFGALIAMQDSGPPEIDEATRLTKADLLVIRELARNATIAPEVDALLRELRKVCMAEAIPVSDRRWRKIVHLLQVAAVTNGRSEANIWDCWLLQHCLWDEPEQREGLYEAYAERVGASRILDPAHLVAIAAALEGQLDKDKSATEQVHDEEGRPLFIDQDGNRTLASHGDGHGRRNGKKLYYAPDGAVDDHGSRVDRTNQGRGYDTSQLNDLRVEPGRHYSRVRFKDWSDRKTYLADKANWHRAPEEHRADLEPKRFHESYVQHRISEVGSYLSQVEQHHEVIRESVATAQESIAKHLWIDGAFAGPATTNLEASLVQTKEVKQRLEKLARGFDQLPRQVDSVVSAAQGGRAKNPVVSPAGAAAQRTIESPQRRRRR